MGEKVSLDKAQGENLSFTLQTGNKIFFMRNAPSFMLQTLKRTFIMRGDAFHANAIYIIPHYGWMIFFMRVHAG